MQINFAYDASVASAPSGFQTALAAAAQFLDGLITNAITVTIQVGWGEDADRPITGGTATGGPTTGIFASYSQLRNDLAATDTSTSDDTVLTNLPLTDPTGTGSFYVSPAQEKAFGLMPANSGEIDGTIGFGTGAAFNFDPVNRAIGGMIDFVGVAEHEITHALGRIAGLQYVPNAYTLLDLFRFSSAGVRNLSGGSPAYFSIDAGRTNLNPFDTLADYGDWASSVRNDAFGYADYGALLAVSPSDVMEMDALGFSVSKATPSPAPAITQISANPGGGYVDLGRQITLTLSMSNTVTVAGGTPSLSLNDGGVATYVSGSGSTMLSFTYTVEAGQNTSNLTVTAVNLNGATIGALSGQSANLSLSGLRQTGPFVATPTSGPSVIDLPANADFTTSQSNTTVVGGGGTSNITLNDSASVFLGDGGSDLVMLTASTSTVVGASGDLTVNAIAGSGFVFAGNGPTLLNVGDSDVTLQGGTGAIRVYATGSGSVLAFSQGAPLFFSGGYGASTVAAGTGADTIFANPGGGQFWGGAGDMLFVGGSGASTAVGGSGNNTLFGGNSGRDLLVAGTGPSTVVGANGTVVIGNGAAPDVLAAGGGSETLAGSGGGGRDLMFGSGGNVTMFAGNGNDTLVASTGNAQMVGGPSTDLFVFTNGAAGGTTSIWNFTPGQDHVALFGYGANVVPMLLQSAVVSGNATSIILPDNTRITFGNITHLTANDILAA